LFETGEDMPDDNKALAEVDRTPCPYCGGCGQVWGVVDDVELIFRCLCRGGSEEAVRWLLGDDWKPPPCEDWII
jgi:hypothetical protein